MAITISGENNNDRILAQDGVIDQISGINIVGVLTATSFVGDVTGDVTGNLTGNVNSTSPLLLQTGGSERFRITGNNELGIAGANYGSSGQVLTSGGSGSAVSWTTISTDLVNDSSPQLGADLDTNGYGILVDDNKVVNFGNNNDLMIYHSGTHSYIKNKTNNLYIMSTNTEYGIEVHGDGKVRLNYDNSPKIETTNTGAVVTGIITATSRVSLGNNTTNAVDLEFGTNRGSAGDTLANINWKWNNTYVAQIRGMAGSDTTNKDDAHLNFYTAAAGSLVERFRITSTGDLSLRSTTQNAYLGLTANSTAINTTLGSTSGTNPRLYLKGVGNGQSDAGDVFIGSGTGGIVQIRSAELIKFEVNSDNSTAEALHITSGGQVNIGGDYTQTAYNLSVTNTGGNLFRIKTADQGDYDLRFMVQNSESNMWHYGTDDFVIGNRYDRKLHFITNGSKRLTIHGSYVGINQTAPQTGLHVNQDWVNSYGSISAEGSANVLVGLGLRSNGNYRGSLIWRDGSSGNYMDISTYGGAYPILFRPNGSEKVRINSNGDLGLLKIADNNTSSAGNHGFRFGSWGIQMRDTGGFNHWYIRRNYGGWQTSPQVTFKGNGYTGVNRLDPTHYLDVDGTSIFRDRIFFGTGSMKSIPFGANVVYDTGISVNAYGYGGSILALCSRNYGAGTNTQSALYLLKFHYDGNNTPGVYYITGNSNFATFGQSASNTLTVSMGASNNVITMFESSVVNP